MICAQEQSHSILGGAKKIIIIEHQLVFERLTIPSEAYPSTFLCPLQIKASSQKKVLNCVEKIENSYPSSGVWL